MLSWLFSFLLVVFWIIMAVSLSSKPSSSELAMVLTAKLSTLIYIQYEVYRPGFRIRPV